VNVCWIAGLLLLFHILDLSGINSNTLCGENMTKKSDFLELELTLAELGVELVLPQLLQNYSLVLLMLFGGG
jgi:hypothetical protein